MVKRLGGGSSGRSRLRFLRLLSRHRYDKFASQMKRSVFDVERPRRLHACSFPKDRGARQQRASGADLLRPELAVRQRAVLVPGFLTETQVQRVLAEVTRPRMYQPYTHAEEDLGPDGEALHTTRYLHCKRRFRRRLPALREAVFSLARAVDEVEGWHLLSQGVQTGANTRNIKHGACPVSIRCAEVHEMVPGGRLSAWDHYDVGSLVTLDVMLEEPESGGEFQTPEADGAATTHNFRRGDALVFPSAKYHRVEAVRRGRRRTLVVEFWCGREVTEDHRCETRVGRCSCPAGGGAGFDLDGIWREPL